MLERNDVNLSRLAKVLEWNRETWSMKYSNHSIIIFKGFLTVLRDLTAILVSSLMNNKRAYFSFNPLNVKFTKWSNTFKQVVGKLPRNCLSVFDHFVRLALKSLKWRSRRVKTMDIYWNIPFVLSSQLHIPIVGPKFRTRSSIPNSIFKISIFSLLWIPKFIKTSLYLTRVTKSTQL